MTRLCERKNESSEWAAHLQVAAVAHDRVQLVHAGVCVMLRTLGRHSGKGAPALLPPLEVLRCQPGMHDR